MTAIILDTETTGVDEPEVIQIGYIGPVPFGKFDHREVPQEVLLFKPSKPISLGALATHHILDEELVDAPPWPGRWLPAEPAGIEYVVGHGVDFDWQAIGSPPWKRICTLALARMTWPELDSHKLAACAYHVLPRQEAKAVLRNAHNAMVDAVLAMIVLVSILEKLPQPPTSWAELWALSERARVPTVMPFGKHKGTPIAQVPPDYKRWLLNQPDVDPYLAKALRA